MNKKIIIGGIASLSMILAGCGSTPASTSGSTTGSSNTGTTSISTGTQSNASSGYTLTEIAKHGSETDCWMTISGKVYDVTKFIPQHPGGKKIIMGCGKDATDIFKNVPAHQGKEGNLTNYYIGELKN